MVFAPVPGERAPQKPRQPSASLQSGLFRHPYFWFKLIGKNRFAVFPNHLPSPTAAFIPNTGIFIP
jgi:hypothetical protein